ncbi:hypothetical protein D3C76_1276490 [compost metagenome]
MDQLGLHIQGCLGHAIGIPGVPPAVPDASRFGGDVQDQLVPAAHHHRHKPVGHPQGAKSIDPEYPLHLGKIQLILHGGGSITQYGRVIDQNIQGPCRFPHPLIGLLHAGPA